MSTLIGFFVKGHKPVEILKKLESLKTEELHEMMFNFGLNLAKTPQWQKRGILIYKHPILLKTEKHIATRWKVKVNWEPATFHFRGWNKTNQADVRMGKQRKAYCCIRKLKN